MVRVANFIDTDNAKASAPVSGVAAGLQPTAPLWALPATVLAIGSVAGLVFASDPWVPQAVGLCNAVVLLIVVLHTWFGRAPQFDQRFEQLQDLHWEIAENESRYRDLLNEQADLISRRNFDGQLKFVNLAYARAFDLDASVSIGSKFQPTIISRDEPLSAEVSGAEYQRRSTELVVTSAGARWIEWHEHAVPGAKPGELEIQSVGRDVTTDRLNAQELREARELAESANRAKSRFLASMSHEIRTPMNGILGMASLLIETEQSSEQKTYTKAIDQSARNLVALIDEILDFSKIEAGKLSLTTGPMSLEAIIQGVVELFAASSQQKGLEIAWSVHESAMPLLIGDPVRVRQIVLNLVSNAVKFTDRGGIVVRCRRDGEITTITVEDTGIGLSEQDRSNLFVEFEQADAAMRRQHGGTGLGLAISKRLARAMGGDIALASTLGTGSVFTVTLKLPNAATETAEPALEIDTSLSVLLAFDRLIERRCLAEVLQGRGIKTVESNFNRAADALEAAALGGQPIDRLVVELDTAPVQAGMLLCKARSIAVRAGRDASSVRGIVLVNVLSRRNLADFRRAGFEAYLVRPVRPIALFEHLGALRSGYKPVVADARANPIVPSFGFEVKSVPAHAPRVLVAEDNDINALLARRMLEKSGCHVTVVSNGRMAVEAVALSLAHPDDGFEIIFMDIFMPELDGLEASREIKELFQAHSDGEGRPPIIALTANAFAEDRERYLAAGMDDYLAKPFDKSALGSILARWTGREEDAQERLPAA